jgi:hypothetical protein
VLITKARPAEGSTLNRSNLCSPVVCGEPGSDGKHFVKEVDEGGEKYPEGSGVVRGNGVAMRLRVMAAGVSGLRPLGRLKVGGHRRLDPFSVRPLLEPRHAVSATQRRHELDERG